MPIFISLPIAKILFLVSAAGVFYMMTRDKRIIMSKLCPGLIIFSVVGGFIFYSCSYLLLGMGWKSMPLAVLRGAFDTARMFFMNANYEVFASAFIGTRLWANVIWEFIFWSLHVSAMIVVQITLVSVFGQKILDFFRLRSGFHSEVYFIKGCDKNALMLGENIATRDAPRQHQDKTNRLIVFLLEEDDDAKKTYEKAVRFGGIVEVLDRNHDLLYYLEKVRSKKLTKIFRKEKKYNVILMSKNTSASDDARSIVGFAKKKGISSENLNIYVFTSSEWDRKKITEIILEKDGDQRKYPYTFHIINETDLLVRQMIKKHPPFDCPNLNFSDGIAAREFTVVILGFGTVGQAALLHLMMNGQFVSKGRMRAIIVDKKPVDELRDCFKHRYPQWIFAVIWNLKILTYGVKLFSIYWMKPAVKMKK